MPYLKKQAGFTLLELVLVIILISIIGKTGSLILAQGLNNFLTLQNISAANFQGEIAIERMTRELRYVASSANITTMTAGTFEFVDIYGNTITYTLSGSQLLRNSEVLATGVNSLTFTYLNSSGSSGASSTTVQYVTIAMNITLNNTNYTLTTTTFLGDISL